MAGGATTDKPRKTYDTGVFQVLGEHGEIITQPVLIGSMDRVFTTRHFKFDQRRALDEGRYEEWMAYCTFIAARRDQLTGGLEFEKWLPSFLGLELDDDDADESEAEEETPEDPTPA